MGKLDNGLDVKFSLKTNMSLGDLIELAKYLDHTPQGWVFSVEINGKDDVIRK